MTTNMGKAVQVVGDDLLVTNPKRVQKAIDENACNALLLKVNQIGSVWESILAVKMAKQAGWGVMTSHRSGETADTFIAGMYVSIYQWTSNTQAYSNYCIVFVFRCACSCVLLWLFA
jgi:enolase